MSRSPFVSYSLDDGIFRFLVILIWALVSCHISQKAYVGENLLRTLTAKDRVDDLSRANR